MAAKSAHLKDLEIEFATLQAKHLDIDLAGLQLRLDKAKVAKAAHRSPRSHGDDQEERSLSIAVSEADNAFNRAQIRAQRLEDQMGPLRAMLSGPERAADAQQIAGKAAKQVAAAVEAVGVVRTTVDRLEALLVTAAEDHAKGVADAAKGVLAAAKEGRAPTSASADRSQVEAIESALAMARAELAEAQAASAAAEQTHQAAIDALQAAQRDAAQLTLELSLRDFAPVVAQYRKLSGRDYWPEADLRRHVYAAERSGTIA